MCVTMQFNWTSLGGTDVKFSIPVAYIYTDGVTGWMEPH